MNQTEVSTIIIDGLLIILSPANCDLIFENERILDIFVSVELATLPI
jgi:hypothetical protein